MYKFKKIVSVIMVLAMVIGLVPEFKISVFAVTNVPTGNYTISSNGDFQLASGYKGQITVGSNVTQAKVIGNGVHTLTNILVASGRSSALELTIENLNITAPNMSYLFLTHGISFEDAGNYAHKLLVKGTCSVTGNYAGIAVIQGNQLTIDKAAGVADDSGAVLTVQGNNASAGIGGYDLINKYGCGDITINGATVNATGAALDSNSQIKGGAGIGNATSYRTDTHQDTITINGGIVTATGGGRAAGIGGGYNSGVSTGACQGVININGGTVTATGNNGGAGIGSGNSGSGYTINISGGTVTATGGSSATLGNGAGIGGGAGENYYYHVVNISGGSVTAVGASGGSNKPSAGIGSGSLSSPGTINISGGTITANGGANGGAGIGGAWGCNGDTVTIAGYPTVIATAGTGAEDIGKGLSGGSSGTLKNGTEDWVYLKFHVTKAGIDLSGATVNINSSNYTTNSIGYTYCFAPKSNTAYTVNASGCDQVSGTASTANISNLINITIIGNDATLNPSSTIKGQSLASFGTSNAVLSSVVAGSASITTTQAADTTNIGSYITLFEPNDSNVSAVKVVKYALGSSTANFETDVAYANQAISDGDFFVVKIIAQNLTTILYYTINVTVTVAPFISTQPNNQTLTFGQTAIFTVVAGGTTPISYQWKKDGTNMNDGGNISGANTASLTISDVSSSDRGNYEVVVTNSVNTITSNVVSLALNLSVPINVVAVGGGGKVNLSWDVVPGATEYRIYQATTSGLYGTPSSIVAGSVYTYESTGLENGTTYYFVIKAANVDLESENSVEVSAVPKTVPDAPINVLATAGNEQAIVVFDAPSNDGGSLITGYTVTSSPGNIIANGRGTTITVKGLMNGTSYKFTVKATNVLGDSIESVESNTTMPYYDSSGKSAGTTDLDNTEKAEVKILFNNKIENVATALISKVDDKTITTVTMNDIELQDKLQGGENNTVVAVSAENYTDIIVGQLNGQSVKNMETQNALFVVKTENITYTLPVSQINIDTVSTQLGEDIQLKNIEVNVKIANASQKTINIVEDTARKNNYQVVIKPVEFEITCTAGNKSVEVSKFNRYVERMVAVPDGIDPQKITTGVIINSDGSFSHVPTKIIIINGKYYVEINSLTNSTYSVIRIPKNFKDVEGHWAKEIITDMSSRLVIDGVTEDTFEADKDIKRAEYVETVVRALGLMSPRAGKDVFTDVKIGSRYYDAVSIAYEYGIISGYGNGIFAPEEKITREQAMVITAKAMSITKPDAMVELDGVKEILKAFYDEEECSDWAMESIEKCIKKGIVRGRGNMMIAPKDNITRAEVAVIVRGLLQKSNLIS